MTEKITAHVICWSFLHKTPLYENMKAFCNAMNIELNFIDMKQNGLTTSSSHVDAIRACKNVTAWGLGHIQPSRLLDNGRNVLFMDNSQIQRSKHIFLDSQGLRGSSTLTMTGLNRESITMAQRQEIWNCLESQKWPIHHGGDKSGPILLALQNVPAYDNAIIAACETYLPKKQFLLRCHPSVQKNGKAAEFLAKYKQHSCDDASKPIIETLKKCSAMVTYNSSAVMASLAMSIPTATLGRGTYSGSFATLECDRVRSLLKSLLSFRIDRISIEQLLYWSYKTEASLNMTYDEVLSNTAIQNWVMRMKPENEVAMVGLEPTPAI